MKPPEWEKKFRLYAQDLWQVLKVLLKSKRSEHTFQEYIGVLDRNRAQFTQRVIYRQTLIFQERGAEQRIVVNLETDADYQPIITISGSFTETVKVPAQFDAQKDLVAIEEELKRAFSVFDAPSD